MVKENKKKIIIYDFDGTLTTDTWPKFWAWVDNCGYNASEWSPSLQKKIDDYRNMEEHRNEDAYTTFFGFFNDLLNKYIEEHNQGLQMQELLKGEGNIQYNPGIELFLSVMKDDSNVKNYILSSGLIEFLKGLKIAKYFDGIYGTPIKQDNNKYFIGIDMENIMSDEKKIMAIQEILAKNGIEENDCSDVIYLGDGYSDLPSMKFISENGGKSILVYQIQKKDELPEEVKKISENIEENGYPDYIVEADYRPGSKLRFLILYLIGEYQKKIDTQKGKIADGKGI